MSVERGSCDETGSRDYCFQREDSLLRRSNRRISDLTKQNLGVKTRRHVICTRVKARDDGEEAASLFLQLSFGLLEDR